MNVALLKKIKTRILREPQKFRMDRWSCGTAHCIGGWACVLMKDPPLRSSHYMWTRSGLTARTRATEALDLGDANKLLFDVFMWPDQFQVPYLQARTRQQRAKIAAKRIDHFIASNGHE